MTLQDAFDLGKAVTAFKVQALNHGMLCILPARNLDTDEIEHMIFDDLCKDFAKIADETDGEEYIEVIRQWLARHQYDITLS